MSFPNWLRNSVLMCLTMENILSQLAFPCGRTHSARKNSVSSGNWGRVVPGFVCWATHPWPFAWRRTMKGPASATLNSERQMTPNALVTSPAISLNHVEYSGSSFQAFWKWEEYFFYFFTEFSESLRPSNFALRDGEYRREQRKKHVAY